MLELDKRKDVMRRPILVFVSALIIIGGVIFTSCSGEKASGNKGPSKGRGSKLNGFISRVPDIRYDTDYRVYKLYYFNMENCIQHKGLFPEGMIDEEAITGILKEHVIENLKESVEGTNMNYDVETDDRLITAYITNIGPEYWKE